MTSGIKAAIARVVQSNRSYLWTTYQFNVSKGTTLNVIKLSIASSGVLHRFTTKKLQIVTSIQDKLLVWLSKKVSHSGQVELKTDLQTNIKVSASAIIVKIWL
jgi:hypothetical protein